MDDIITHFPFYNRTYEHVHGVNHSAFRPLRRRKRYYQTYNVFAQVGFQIDASRSLIGQWLIRGGDLIGSERKLVSINLKTLLS